MTPESGDPDLHKKPGVLQLIGSVLSAAIGIQSNKNRERDFKHGKLHIFVISGVIFVALFIFSVYSVVRLVLRQAGY
jgi:uncharacterized membrane protein